MGLQGKKSSYPHEWASGIVAERSEGLCPLHGSGCFPIGIACSHKWHRERENLPLGMLNVVLWTQLLRSPPKEGGCYHLSETTLAG